MTPGYLTDPSGKPSHTRVLVVLCVPALVLVPLLVWAYLSLVGGKMVGIDPTVPLYVTTGNAVVLGYAGYKSKGETKAPLPPVTTT